MPRLSPFLIRTLAAVIAAVLAAVLPLGAALGQDGSASDESVPASFNGSCTASAVIAGYGTVDPKTSGGVYTVPKSGSASYTGTVAVEGKDRVTSGKVSIALPLGLPSIPIKSWGSDNTDGNSHSGSVTWDIPSIVPGNVEMTVSGYHQDEGVRCEGTIKVKLAGSAFGGILGAAALGLTVVSIAGAAWSMWPSGKGD